MPILLVVDGEFYDLGLECLPVLGANPASEASSEWQQQHPPEVTLMYSNSRGQGRIHPSSPRFDLPVVPRLSAPHAPPSDMDICSQFSPPSFGSTKAQVYE